MKIPIEAEISRPPQLVFPYLADPEKAMQWQKNVVSGEIIEARPEIIGTRFQEVIEEDGNRLEMSGVITAYVPNCEIGFHLESKIHVVNVTYTLEEGDPGSKLRVEAEIRWKFPMNIVSILIGRRMKRELRAGMESEVLELKRILAAESM